MPDLSNILPELVGSAPAAAYLGIAASGGRKPNDNDYLYFQYWPTTLQDSYDVEYAEHMIPGGSHPLYQWVGGRGRTISFQAVFTSEVSTQRDNTGTAIMDHGNIALLPSGEFTTDVEVALAKFRAWQRPDYGKGSRVGTTEPPPILSLCFPKTMLGGEGGEIIKVIMRQAPITIESWFPNGQTRIATIDLTFNEIVQSGAASGNGSSVSFIGREPFDGLTKKARTRPGGLNAPSL